MAERNGQPISKFFKETFAVWDLAEDQAAIERGIGFMRSQPQIWDCSKKKLDEFRNKATKEALETFKKKTLFL